MQCYFFIACLPHLHTRTPPKWRLRARRDLLTAVSSPLLPHTAPAHSKCSLSTRKGGQRVGEEKKKQRMGEQPLILRAPRLGLGVLSTLECSLGTWVPPVVWGTCGSLLGFTPLLPPN